MVASFGVGFGAFSLTRSTSAEFAAVGLLAASLSISLAMSKTTTACGRNVLASLWRRNQGLSDLGGATIYLITATITAGLIGSALGLIGGSLGSARALGLAAPVFAYLGLVELGIVRPGWIASLRWQVPSDWVRNPRTAPFVWGVCLGSGVATWMPYPSYFGLLLLVFVLPMPWGFGLMAAYGASRAAPAVIGLKWQSRFLEDLARDSWRLRLLGHMVAGCLCFAVSGSILGSALT